MKTRPAQCVDIPAILSLAQEQWARSAYAGTPVEIDVATFKKMAVNGITRHGRIGQNGMAVFVSEHDGRVVGVIVGILDRIYGVATHLQATDLLFAVAPDAPKTAALGLLRAFDEWWQQDESVYEVVNGDTGITGADAGRLFAAFGREKYGSIWRRMNKGTGQ